MGILFTEITFYDAVLFFLIWLTQPALEDVTRVLVYNG